MVESLNSSRKKKRFCKKDRRPKGEANYGSKEGERRDHYQWKTSRLKISQVSEVRIKKSNPKYMQADFANAVSLSQSCVSEIGEPSSFEQRVMKKWENAMREGISALKKNETWDLVPLPAGVKPISCKWVYKVKRRSDGSVERARLIARGFSLTGLTTTRRLVPWQR